ncbi:MAG TPA: glycosyltransferase family A protein [Vicinamibacterales bacterium]|nr:glycosyltransferase family A protein [Vicinamibacterales bacterium]
MTPLEHPPDQATNGTAGLARTHAPEIAVSVIVPAYNAAQFIGRTVESVLRQTFDRYELIVVNDGSPDTPDLERALQPFRERIVYVVQPNAGPSGARNNGILRARGEFIAFLDSDDVWRPEFLSTQMRLLSADPSIDLVYSNGVIVGDVPVAGREQMSMAPSRGPVTFEKLLRGECTVLTSCVVVRRQCVIDAGLFDGRFRRSEDFHLWVRLAQRGARIAYHRTVLVEHRQRPGSLSDDRRAMAHAAIEVMQDLQATLPLTPVQQDLLRQHMAEYQVYLELDAAKRLLLAGAYGPAGAALGRARTWEAARWPRARLRLLEVGVCCMPGVMRRAYGRLRRGALTSPEPEPPGMAEADLGPSAVRAADLE